MTEQRVRQAGLSRQSAAATAAIFLMRVLRIPQRVLLYRTQFPIKQKKRQLYLATNSARYSCLFLMSLHLKIFPGAPQIVFFQLQILIIGFF